MSKTTEDISKHIARVQLKLESLILELNKRCMNHDASKLKEPEISLWERMDAEERYPYGSKEYFDKIERNKEVFNLHYQNNSHHPEHYFNGVLDMDLLDLIEMLCDWISYKENITYNEASSIVEEQGTRFGISADLLEVFKNTLANYFVNFQAEENKQNTYLDRLKKTISK